jgi:organic hydroperoxide reductase OsmC/OhrA
MPAGTKEHRYTAAIVWSGNRGTGTSSYRAYGRDHEIASGEKPVIAGSSDPAFRGDGARWNPEDLLVSALSACHMLSYLHLCAVAGIVVVAYEDSAEGTMRETADGGGRFTGAVLRPRVTIASGDPQQATRLHEEAHRLCFIASSVDFPVRCEPEIGASGAEGMNR